MSAIVAQTYTSKDTFSHFCPISDWKKTEGGRMMVGGFVSDELEDRHGEIVIQKGLNFDDFVKYGVLNDNHSDEMTRGAVIGVPDEEKPITWLTKGEPNPLTGAAAAQDGWYAMGYFLNTQRGRDAFELGLALQETPHRRLGFSLQGKTLRKSEDGRIVHEARVRHLAITHQPANPRSAGEFLLKTFDAVDAEFEREQRISALNKALAAGSSIEASSTPVPGDGFALREESLDGTRRKAKNDDDDDDDDDDDGLTFEKVLRRLHEAHPNLTLTQARAATKAIFENYEAGR